VESTEEEEHYPTFARLTQTVSVSTWIVQTILHICLSITSSKVTPHRLAMDGILLMAYVCLSVQHSPHFPRPCRYLHSHGQRCSVMTGAIARTVIVTAVVHTVIVNPAVIVKHQISIIRTVISHLESVVSFLSSWRTTVHSIPAFQDSPGSNLYSKERLIHSNMFKKDVCSIWRTVAILELETR